MKKIFSIMLSLLMAVAIFAMPVSASSAQTIIIEGETYNVTQSVDSEGNKQVTVVGGGEKNIVTVNDNDAVTIETQDLNTGRTICNQTVSTSGETMARETRATNSASSPFWGYSYSMSDSSEAKYGLFWSLKSGDKGSYSAFDNKNMTARGYAEDFKDDVLDIKNQQAAAIAAGGTALASAIAAGITAATGVGAIVGIVVALGGTATMAAFWVAAYSSSVSANYNFNRFCASV